LEQTVLDTDYQPSGHKYGMMFWYDESLEAYKSYFFINDGNDESPLVLTLEESTPNHIEVYSTMEADHNSNHFDVEEFANFLGELCLYLPQA